MKSKICPNREDGVALVILVWFLAAMSLLVAALVMQARVDVKLAQLHVARAQVEAVADGGIQLALAELLINEREEGLDSRAIHYSYPVLGDTEVAVSFTPLAGLIDLNLATEDLLFNLFSKGARIDENVARELAVSVVEWRSSGSAKSLSDDPDWQPGDVAAEPQIESVTVELGIRRGRFEAIEDLLLVPGIDRIAYETMRDSVAVSQRGQSGVDWVSAPESVLYIISSLEEGDAAAVVESRAIEEAEGLVIPEEIDLAFLSEGGTQLYRVDAVVATDETAFHRRRWVHRSRPGVDGLPWEFFRTEAVRVASDQILESMAALAATGEAVNAGN